MFVLMGAALMAGPPLGAWYGWWSWWLTASCVLTVAGSAEYLGWYAICFAHGLVHAPSRPWHLRISADALHISADDLTATLPLDRIAEATWRFDDDFETLKGIEGVLCLSLHDGTSVPVHEGAEGFWTLLGALDARALVPACRSEPAAVDSLRSEGVAPEHGDELAPRRPAAPWRRPSWPICTSRASRIS